MSLTRDSERSRWCKPSPMAPVHTKSMAILLEVVQEGLAHLLRAPLVLLVDLRHVCGLRVAVEGYLCGMEASPTCSKNKSLVLWKSQAAAAGAGQGDSASSRMVTQRGSGGCARQQHSLRMRRVGRSAGSLVLVLAARRGLQLPIADGILLEHSRPLRLWQHINLTTNHDLARLPMSFM
jgi:hypothetical protein